MMRLLPVIFLLALTFQPSSICHAQKLKMTLKVDTKPVIAVVFSPDGKTLATSSDKTIKLWTVATGELKKTITVNKNPWTLFFSPNQKILVGGVPVKENGALSFWDVDTGRELLSLKTKGVCSGTFSRDGKKLIALPIVHPKFSLFGGSFGGGSRKKKPVTGGVWNALTGKQILEFRVGVSLLWLSNDGNTVGLGQFGRVGILELWSLATGKKVGTIKVKDFKGHMRFVRTGLFAWNFKTKLVAGHSPNSQQIEVVEDFLTQPKSRLKIKLDIGERSLVQKFNPQGTVLISLLVNVQKKAPKVYLKFWRLKDGESLAILKFSQAEVRNAGITFLVSPHSTIALSPDGSHIAAIAGHTVKIWDITKLK